jgi:hypothetical protein
MLPDTTGNWPLNRNRIATQSESHSGLNRDKVAMAVLGLKSSMGGIPELPIEGTRRSAASLLWFCLGGSTAALVAGIIVISSGTAPQPSQSPQMASATAGQAAPQAGPVTTTPAPLQSAQMASAIETQAAAAAVGSISPTSPIAKDDHSAPQAEPRPAMSPSQSPKVTNAQPETAPVAQSQSNRATRFNANVIATFIGRAQTFLKSGDFAAARLLLRPAADAGSANATLMLGATFDPIVIHELGAIGIESDIAQARKWYQKAAKLGSDVAAQRLAKLGQIGQ